MSNTITSDAAAEMARAKWAAIPREARTAGAKKAARARWAKHAKKGTTGARKRSRKARKSSK